MLSVLTRSSKRWFRYFQQLGKELHWYTCHLRGNRRYMQLIYDGYTSHIKPSVQLQFYESRIVKLRLPSDTSHFLQPLDVSVFSPFKKSIQKEVHGAYGVLRKLNISDLSDIISKLYQQSFSSANIISFFRSSGHWNYKTSTVDPYSLLQSKYLNYISEEPTVRDEI